MSGKRVRCDNCGTELTESTDVSPEARSPCPECGSLARKIIVEISEEIHASSSVSATLTSGSGQVIKVGTVTETESLVPIQPRKGTSIREMPTEVIAESLRIQITLLPPEPGGPSDQWLGDVEVWGHSGLVGVGDLSDSLLEIAQWLESLAARWQEHRTDEPDSLES